MPRAAGPGGKCAANALGEAVNLGSEIAKRAVLLVQLLGAEVRRQRPYAVQGAKLLTAGFGQFFRARQR